MRYRVDRYLLTIWLLLAGALCWAVPPALAQTMDTSSLDSAFAGARTVDLTTSSNHSVQTLRDIIGIPAPREPVLVKTFRRDRMPEALRPAFETPQVSGVTIHGRYIAIIHTEFSKEYDDILSHELVHAYITLASPKPLPLWFQEASAVHFSIDKGSKFYGKPAEDQVGVMVGRKIELPEYYKNKLQNFHFLIEKVGKPRFYEWYRQAVVSGVVDARPLLGLERGTSRPAPRSTIPVWAFAVGAGIVLAVSIAGYYAMKRERDIW